MVLWGISICLSIYLSISFNFIQVYFYFSELKDRSGSSICFSLHYVVYCFKLRNSSPYTRSSVLFTH